MHSVNHFVCIVITNQLADVKLGAHCESDTQSDANYFTDRLADAKCKRDADSVAFGDNFANGDAFAIRNALGKLDAQRDADSFTFEHAVVLSYTFLDIVEKPPRISVVDLIDDLDAVENAFDDLDAVKHAFYDLDAIGYAQQDAQLAGHAVIFEVNQLLGDSEPFRDAELQFQCD